MCGDKEFVALFPFKHCCIQHGSLYEMKAKVIYVYFLRMKLVVKLVFEVKSEAEYLSSYIYDYRFGPSSPITQNLTRENDLLAWSIPKVLNSKLWSYAV